MPLPFTRPATAVAFVLAVGLAALPACGKKASTTPATPAPEPGPAPIPPAPNTTSGGDPGAPKGPIFRGADPRTAAARMTAQNNMKFIALGLHNFHDTYQGLPAGYADKTGKPGLSWRVAILPFIEHDNLFRQFKLDEPWDSENNKKLIQYMPKTFAPPSTDTNGYTFTRGFTGPNTWLPPQTAAGRPGQPLLGAKLFNFVDGTSNTILVADAGDAVIWTKPDEVVFAPPALPKLGGVFDAGMVVAMGDGSVRFIRKGIEARSLLNAIQINDGNVVNLD